MISEIGETGHSARDGMADFAYRIVSLLPENPILPIFAVQRGY